MSILTNMLHVARSPGDPSIVHAGPSSRPAADTVANMLGWFSLGLGALEIVSPRTVTRALGMEGREGLVRAYGFREIASGVASLSPDKHVGLWSRVGGDVIDLATLLSAHRDDNPKKQNVSMALAAVVGITLLDLASAEAVSVKHSRPKGPAKSYADRSGLPKGIEASRGAVRPEGPPPVEQTTTPSSAGAGQGTAL